MEFSCQNLSVTVLYYIILNYYNMLYCVLCRFTLFIVLSLERSKNSNILIANLFFSNYIVGPLWVLWFASMYICVFGWSLLSLYQICVEYQIRNKIKIDMHHQKFQKHGNWTNWQFIDIFYLGLLIFILFLNVQLSKWIISAHALKSMSF